MFCSPLGCAAYRAHAKQIAFAPRHLAFVPCSSKVALVSSHLSVSLGFRICPNCACTQPFLVPCSFPVFCHSRRGVFRCKHCNKGSQVPACLERTRRGGLNQGHSRDLEKRPWEGGVLVAANLDEDVRH